MSARTVPRSVLGAIVLVFGISACSGEGKSTDEADLTASQVCASTFDTSAAKALQRIGDTTKFTELPGSNESGKPSKFSLKNAASTVHKDQTQRNQCVVFKAGDKSGHPLIDIDFSASKYIPKTETSESGGDSEKTFYSIGSYAQTDGSSSALLYFKCPTQDPSKASSTTPYIRASLTSAPGQISTKATGRDLMTVLNSLSGAMAKQLDCASQAALRSELPASTPSGNSGTPR
ncbi:hypothetical protein OH768_14900 [Streptomyces sp. NBC_01622]|uniref:hypothetical protein n=1 Tax=Streptomyces sp. NBC_01622 TaxID=2975903 RepID=UPI00386919D3|nr:hypothetical protein OH768_14900 [Streptomyces sp. NBC_01622]